jgi:hypothetical protein
MTPPTPKPQQGSKAAIAVALAAMVGASLWAATVRPAGESGASDRVERSLREFRANMAVKYRVTAEKLDKGEISLKKNTDELRAYSDKGTIDCLRDPFKWEAELLSRAASDHDEHKAAEEYRRFADEFEKGKAAK